MKPKSNQSCSSVFHSAPALRVTGTVVASLRPGDAPHNRILAPAGLVGGSFLIPDFDSVKADQMRAFAAVAGTVSMAWSAVWGNDADFWQFNAPEVLTAFTDWQKALADIAFSERQLISIRDLARDRDEAQRKVVDQMRVLVGGGTESQKNLALEETNQRQYRIQGRREVHEAESAIKVARRNEAALARQLQQSGLDPALLKAVTSDVDIVMAEVPEAKLTRVQVGKKCEASFFGIPGQIFTGEVKAIAPVVTKERRTLRVLFTIDDLNDQLRPGMFAEIGLDTEPRDMLLIPSDGVLHVGRTDYVLAAEGKGRWRVENVLVGEFYGSQVEIISGLHPGERVMGQGAILLKPLVVKALQNNDDEHPAIGGAR